MRPRKWHTPAAGCASYSPAFSDFARHKIRIGYKSPWQVPDFWVIVHEMMMLVLVAAVARGEKYSYG